MNWKSGFLVRWGFLIFVLSACARAEHVIDGSTGKPLAGVYVIARWDGTTPMPAKAISGCYQLMVTQTDEGGEYSMSSWSWTPRALITQDSYRTVFYYKAGYTEAGKDEGKDRDPVVLWPDARPARERLQYILHLETQSECGSREQRKGKLIPLYQAVLNETRGIATTRDLALYLSSAIFQLEILELGYEAAQATLLKRDKEWGIR